MLLPIFISIKWFSLASTNRTHTRGISPNWTVGGKISDISEFILVDQLEQPASIICICSKAALATLGSYRPFLSISDWPQLTPHDLWPYQCITFRSEVFPSKFGRHKVFLSNLTPSCPLHDLRPQHCTTLWSGILPIKFDSHRAFLSNFTPNWPRLTPVWHVTPALQYTLLRGSCY